MTRRKMMLMAVLGATVVGLANLVGFANHNAVFASDEVDDDGELQLSVYTTKDGKFSEVVIDHVTGKVAKVEPITTDDDLTVAMHKAQPWPRQRPR